MPVTIVMGAQWGDEGKGKIVDELASKAHIIVRFNGGDNAGHTTINEFGESKLHLIPCGIFNPQSICIIERGVLINIINLEKEMKDLLDKGVSLRNLRISPFCHLIMPWHIAADKGAEKKFKIGTTLKGIGPCVEAKANRRFAFRICDLLDLKVFGEKFREIFLLNEKELRLLYEPGLMKSFEEELENFILAAIYLREGGWITNTQDIIHKAVKKEKPILLEGAQGTLLDWNWGTFPYNTSSDVMSIAACMFTGIPMNAVKHNIGIAKAYLTRVGEGPFPTEIFGPEGDTLRKLGKEFGATTGRPRRCGWLDLMLLRYAARINNFTSIALTKVDILGKFPVIKLGIGYKGLKRDINELDFMKLEKMEPVYRIMEGDWGNLSRFRWREEFPKTLRDYLNVIEDFIEIPVTLISTGESRGNIVPPPNFLA